MAGAADIIAIGAILLTVAAAGVVDMSSAVAVMAADGVTADRF
jgi:hypothetical protein